MDDIVLLAKAKADELGIKNIVVASGSGATASRVFEVLGERFRIFTVGNEDLRDVEQILREHGAEVIIQPKSLFQEHDPEGRGIFLEALEDVVVPGKYDPVRMIENTLRLFGEGAKVCVEVALMVQMPEYCVWMKIA